MLYLTNTFTPSMVSEGLSFFGVEIYLENVILLIEGGFTSAVSHENTAEKLTTLLGIPVDFNRVNLSLEGGDTVIACIPQIRHNKAEEFRAEEVNSAEFRFFLIKIEGEE